jgi:disease resistance protein RPM1
MDYYGEGAFDSGGLLRKLTELLQDKYNLQKGIKQGILFLRDELMMMHEFLSRIGGVPIEQVSKLDRVWARDAREVCYDIDDMVDTFLVRVDDGHVDTNLHRVKQLGEKAINFCGGIKKNARTTRSQIPDGGTSHQIADEIQEFKIRIMEMSERRRRYQIDELSSFGNRRTTGTVDPRLPALYRNERELVGIDEPRDEMIRMLAPQGDDERELKIVSILGMGGIGKTTLAKAVYKSMEGQFECSAFVSVSRNPDMRKVLEDILLELDEAKYQWIFAKPLDERQLIHQVLDFLEHKRYARITRSLLLTSAGCRADGPLDGLQILFYCSCLSI